MKNRLTGTCGRRKNIGTIYAVFSLKMFLLGVVFLLLTGITYAQNADAPDDAPQPVKLPPAFARFSASDIFQQVFDSYDPKTGRVASIHNLVGKPALVEINEAALWKAQGQDQLVVLIDIEEDDTFTGLCGNCSTLGFLAVLKKNGDALSLVAKQLNLPSSGAPVEYESLDEGDFIQYGGHDNVALDLAPYKLNSRETLIGVRLEHIWLPTSDWSTRLSLFRIEGGQLREVFNEMVVERMYPVASERGFRMIDKTISTLSLVPSRRATNATFNELSISKITYTCSDANADDDCDSKDDEVKKIKTEKELWQFDGGRYVLSTPAKR